MSTQTHQVYSHVRNGLRFSRGMFQVEPQSKHPDGRFCFSTVVREPRNSPRIYRVCRHKVI